MIRYNSKDYANFAQFAKSYQNRYQKANFNEVNFELTKDVNNLCKDDVKEEGVYQIKGYKFFMTRIFENTYTEISANGNEKNCNSFQILYLEKPNKKGERVIKINDSSQLKRTVGALCGENPSGIVCKGRKKIDEEVINAKFAEFAEFCKSLNIPFNHMGLLDMALYEYRKGIKEAELAEKMARYKKAGLSDTEIELLTKLA